VVGSAASLTMRVMTVFGAGLKPPQGATVIDAKGGWVFPGFIEAQTQLGLTEISQVDAMRDDDEGTDPVTPQLDVMDSYYTESDLIPVARMTGLTSAFAAPGEGNVIGGRGAVVRLAGLTPDAVLIRGAAALTINLGEPPKARYGPRNQSPQTRMGVAAVVREAFTKARDYKAKWDEYERKKQEFERGGTKPAAQAPASGKGKDAPAGKEKPPEPPSAPIAISRWKPSCPPSPARCRSLSGPTGWMTS